MSSPFNEAKFNALLEGLEISIVKFNEIRKQSIFRLDAEPHQKRKTRQFLTAEKLSDIAIINPPKKEIDVSKKKCSFIPMTSLGAGVITNRETVEISDFYKGYTYFAENDIIIAKITPCMEHGKCAIATNLKNRIGFGSTEYNVFRVNDSRFLTEYIFVFLNRPVIREDAQKNMVGTSGRQRVSTIFYENLKIPLLPSAFQSKIAALVKEAHAKLERSKSLYKEAEDLLLDELGLSRGFDFANAKEIAASSAAMTEKTSVAMTEKTSAKMTGATKDVIVGLDPTIYAKNISIKRLSDVTASGRLDAEYWQRKYDEIENKVKTYKGGFDLVKNLFCQNLDVCDYSKSEYNYIEIGDISIGDGTAESNLVQTENLPDNAKRVLHKDDILISKVRPYRGAIAIILANQKDLIGSGAFTVLHEKSKYKKEVLHVLLRSQDYREWLLKWNVGSSYPVIKDEDILNLPIPILPAEIQEKIAALVQASFSLKGESLALLESAKSAVENEIEG